MSNLVMALAGGVGGAKLALGLSNLLKPGNLAVIVNTADDEEFHGLHVSPDLDTMMYNFAGLSNTTTGWGIKNDRFETLKMLSNYGSISWFKLGDKDLATHIKRTDLLNQGWTLSEVTNELCQLLGIKHTITPMTDNKIRTLIETEEGTLPFQDYFVNRKCKPTAKAIHFTPSKGVIPSPTFNTSLEKASALIICPSNPFLSIAPILSIKGIRERILRFKGPKVAISPIIGGKTLGGPAAKLLKELGHPVSSIGVANQYLGLCDYFVIDHADAIHSSAIKSLGMIPIITNTIMTSKSSKKRLAGEICQLLGVSYE